jgi:hypothetical protein
LSGREQYLHGALFAKQEGPALPDAPPQTRSDPLRDHGLLRDPMVPDRDHLAFTDLWRIMGLRNSYARGVCSCHAEKP